MANVINTRLVTDTAVSAGGIIPVGTVVHKAGCNLSAGGNAINISGSGYYKVTANVTYAPTTDTSYTVTLYSNGTEVATSYITPASAGGSDNSTVIGVVYNRCGCASKAISVGVSVAGTCNEMDVVVERL